MRAAGGNHTTTNRIYRGCSDSKRCPICGMCCNWSRLSAKCRDCYTLHWHCFCGERGMDAVANFVSQKTDRPMTDLNGPKGQVEFHGDPARDLAQIVQPNLVDEDGP